MQEIKLKYLDKTLKLFITFFLILLTAGYVIGIVLIDHKTSFRISDISEEYVGTPEDSEKEEIKYSKSPNEIYIFLHNHIISLTILFFLTGLIFYFSSIVSDNLKLILLIEPFIAIITTFGGIWLIWKVSPLFAWLVIVSGISMFACYFIMVFLILKELWLTKK